MFVCGSAYYVLFRGDELKRYDDTLLITHNQVLQIHDLHFSNITFSTQCLKSCRKIEMPSLLFASLIFKMDKIGLSGNGSQSI